MSIAEHEVYYNHYQIPIFFVLIVVLWILFSIRILSIYLHDSWRTWMAASAGLVAIAVALCTSYVGLLLASYIYNKRITDIRGPLVEPGDIIDPDPSTYSEQQLLTVYNSSYTVIKVLIAERYVLTIALWTVKLAFVMQFIDFRQHLGMFSRWLLFSTGVFILATYCASIWSLVSYFADPTSTGISMEDARDGNLELGLRFESLNFMNELVLTVCNIATDVLLGFLAWRIIRSLSVSLTAIYVPLFMVSVTLLIAIARLVMVMLTTDNTDVYVTYLTIPFQFFSEAEAFFAAWVSCIPGIRSFFRQRVRSRRAKSFTAGWSNTARSSLPAPPPERSDSAEGLVVTRIEMMERGGK